MIERVDPKVQEEVERRLLIATTALESATGSLDALAEQLRVALNTARGVSEAATEAVKAAVEATKKTNSKPTTE